MKQENIQHGMRGLIQLSTSICASGFSAAIVIAYVTVNFIYLAPSTPLTKDIKGPVSEFMATHFAQAWTLFAPNPGFSSTKMIIRCSSGETVGEWFDPIQPLLERHYENRFTTSGLIVKQYKFIATNLRVEIARQTRDQCQAKIDSCARGNEAVERSSAYRIARDFAAHLCATGFATKGGSSETRTAEFKILDIYPPTYAQRHSEKKSTSIVAISFTPFSTALKTQNLELLGRFK